MVTTGGTSTGAGDDVPWLDDTEQRAWRGFISGTTLVFRELESRLQDVHDLSMDDYAVLVLLSEAPERRARMSEIADASIIARSNLTYRVGRLEQRGIVSRCRHDEDGRGIVAQLTDEGFRVLEAAARDHVRAVRELVLDPMTREEFLTVGMALGKVFGALVGDCDEVGRRA